MSASLYGRSLSLAVSRVGSVVISDCTRQRHSRERSAQAEQIVAQNIGEHQSPLALLEVRHRLKRVAGKSRERPAETDHHQQSPARVHQHTFAGPDKKEAHNEAANDVDGERSVREDGAELLRRETAEQISQVGADNR